MTSNTFTNLLQQIDAEASRYEHLDRYYRGEQPLAFLAPEARSALGNRFGRMASNIPRLAVTALAERLRVTGFRADRGEESLWADWLGNDLDQWSATLHREALTLGKAYVFVWADRLGRPQVSVESARQVAVVRDPATRQVLAAVKRWRTKTTTEAILYTAEAITHYRANSAGATTAGFKIVEQIDNPLGVVPVVAFRNNDRLLDDGVSEIDDLIPLVDALNKILADQMVSSEYVGRPRRWATGIELQEDEDGNAVNPFPEGSRMMLSEDENTKFGQLDAGNLAGYQASVDVILGQIMAVSALPSHYVGITSSNPASADALRASEASLTARAEARQAQFGRSWEQVARLMICVRDGGSVDEVDARVKWADAATRSTAQEADAIVKLYQAGLLPTTVALERLGYSGDEIDRIRELRRAESFDKIVTDPQAVLQ